MRPLMRPARWGTALALLASLGGAAVAEQPEPAASPNPLGALSKDSLQAFRTRPLFNPTRSEPTLAPAQAESPAPAAEAPPPEPPPLKLVGLIGGTNKLAVVRLDSDAKAQILGTGDKLGDWTVTVLDSGLRLEIADRRVEIALFASTSHASGGMRKKGAPQPDGQTP